LRCGCAGRRNRCGSAFGRDPTRKLARDGDLACQFALGGGVPIGADRDPAVSAILPSGIMGYDENSWGPVSMPVHTAAAHQPRINLWCSAACMGAAGAGCRGQVSDLDRRQPSAPGRVRGPARGKAGGPGSPTGPVSESECRGRDCHPLTRSAWLTRSATLIARSSPRSRSRHGRIPANSAFFVHARFPGRWSMGRKAATSPGLRSILSTSLA
jgi:hypothetical protein